MKEKIFNLIQQNSISLSKIQKLTNLNEQEIEKILQELIDEQLIFLNTTRKYEAINPEYKIGILEKTSKGSSYVIVDGQKISISSSSLHTALKNGYSSVKE